MKEFTLKVVAVIGGLFILFLLSGGIYQYIPMGSNTVRINKINGSVSAIDFNEETRRYFWNDMTDHQPLPSKNTLEIESAAQ